MNIESCLLDNCKYSFYLYIKILRDFNEFFHLSIAFSVIDLNCLVKRKNSCTNRDMEKQN